MVNQVSFIFPGLSNTIRWCLDVIKPMSMLAQLILSTVCFGANWSSYKKPSLSTTSLVELLALEPPQSSVSDSYVEVALDGKGS